MIERYCSNSSAALLSRRTVIQLVAIDFAREMKKDVHFVLQLLNELGLRENHVVSVERSGNDSTPSSTLA